jgi:DNA topoisomerase-1
LGDQGLEGQVKQKEEEIDPRNIHALVLDDLRARVRVGRYGAYLEQDNNGEPVRVSLPDNYPPGDLVEAEVLRLLHDKTQGPTPLGHHPKTGEPVFVLIGPYGPYVQLGENGENGNGGKAHKPHRVSLPEGTRPEDVTLGQALGLLQLPRVLGQHPDTGQDIEAGIGRFGPYVRHNGDYRSLGKQDDVLTISLARALELLAKEKGERRKAAVVREIGPHPDDGEPVAIYEGRYGPYVKHGKLNASLPKGAAVDSLTMDEALALLAQKKASKAAKRKTNNKKK